MKPHEWLGFVASALVYSAIFLIAVIVYGGPGARAVAVASALVACFSQYIGQDQSRRAYVASIYFAYLGFILALLALILFARGI